MEMARGMLRLPLDGWVMFPRTVVGTGDFAISFLIHLSRSEIAHHVFKSHWEEWERASATHRQRLGGGEAGHT